MTLKPIDSNEVKAYYQNDYDEALRLSDAADNRHHVERDVKQILFLRALSEFDTSTPVTITDVACGTGIHTLFLAEYARANHLDWSINALDLVPEHISQLQEAIEDRHLDKVHAVVGDAADLPFADGSTDLLINSALYHVRTLDMKARVIGSSMRTMKTGGTMMFDFLPRLHAFMQGAARYGDGFLSRFPVIGSTEQNTMLWNDGVFSYDTTESLRYLMLTAFHRLDIQFFTPDLITRFITDDVDQWNQDSLRKWEEFIMKTQELDSNSQDYVRAVVDMSEHGMMIMRR
jgi:ubiquinone/menaquinone biosynthesis C-methylase UbiE